MKKRFKVKRNLQCLSLLLLPLGLAHGAGFALIEQSASGQGNAFAGAATAAEDPSVMYFNPAAMTLLKGRQSTLGMHVVNPQADFTNNGSALATALGGGTLAGANDSGGQTGVVPNLYYMQHIDPDVVIGLGINAPFGLSTEYDSNWVGRYHAVKSDLKTVNINPSIAWRLDDQWSLGAGVSAQYIDVTLTSAVDLGSVCVASEAASLLPAGTCASVSAAPQGKDGFADLQGDDWGYGFNLGVMFEPGNDTRIALAYRSKVSQNVSGDATFTVPSTLSFLQATGNFTNTTVNADVTLPESASLGFYQQLNAAWSVMADWTWTHWNRFRELRIVYGSSQADSVTTENWEDSNRFSIGTNYRVDPALVLRAGLAYDETPIPDTLHRTALIPGNSRRWLSLGVGWNWSQSARLDVGYSHLFVNATEIDNTFESSVPTLKHTLKGSFDASVDILSAQLNWKY